MILLDSNIIIYSTQPEHDELRQLLQTEMPAVSTISQVEVLGYHRLTEIDRRDFEAFFAAARILPIDDVIIGHAIRFRQIKKMTLGDALIAGTALAHRLVLVTRNTKDFDWITELSTIDPFKAPPIS